MGSATQFFSQLWAFHLQLNVHILLAIHRYFYSPNTNHGVLWDYEWDRWPEAEANKFEPELERVQTWTRMVMSGAVHNENDCCIFMAAGIGFWIPHNSKDLTCTDVIDPLVVVVILSCIVPMSVARVGWYPTADGIRPSKADTWQIDWNISLTNLSANKN